MTETTQQQNERVMQNISNGAQIYVEGKLALLKQGNTISGAVGAVRLN